MGSQTEDQIQSLPADFERRNVSYADGRQVTWVVARFSPDRWTWRIANDSSNPKNVQAWREALKSNLVINGSYFDEKYRPAGYYYDEQSMPATSSTVAWPNTDQQANPNAYTGLLVVRADSLYLFYLPTAPPEIRQPPSHSDSALLTYPTLLSHGLPLVKEDSKKYARRTILAQDASSTTYVLTTESGATSLYEAAQWLAAQPEKFQIALNLDGGPSTGLSYQANGSHFEITSAPVPNILSATQKR